MAERRMFAKTIIDSDAFLEMSPTARLLYYDLGMRADDDGFVNSPKKIMRMVGASEDDLRVLALRKFIIPFESGVVVIKHWRIHNYIQKDRYKETTYKNEKATLYLDENNAYSQTEYELPGQCIQNVYSMYTQDRLGKDSIGEDSIGKDNNPPIVPPKGDGVGEHKYSEKFLTFWQAYPKKVGKGDAEKAFKKAIAKVSLDDMLTAIEQQKKSAQWKRDNGQYIPNPSTWLNQERWDDELEEGSDLVGVKRVSGNAGLYSDEYIAELASKIHYDN